MLHKIGEDGVTETVTDTKQSIIPTGFIDVKYDAETNTLTVIAGEDEFPIKLNAGAASFVFEPQILVDGVSAVKFSNFIALKYTGKDLDSEKEIWTTSVAGLEEAWEKYIKDNEIDEETITENMLISWATENGYIVNEALPTKATYHVNYDLDLDDTYTYNIIYKDVENRTRALSENFDMTAEFVKYDPETKKLTLDLNYTGVPASATYYDNHMTLFALQVSKEGKVYTSDYATFVVNNIVAPKIADPHAVVKEFKSAKLKEPYEEHYRRGTVGISGNDKGQYAGDYSDYGYHEYFRNAVAGAYVAPWKKSTSNDDAGMDFAHSTCDTAIVYNTTTGLDLNAITVPHYSTLGGSCFKPICCGEDGYELDYGRKYVSSYACDEMTKEEMEAFGLEFKYEVVKNFISGKPETDQMHFVDNDRVTEEGIFFPATYDETGTAAIGRTPIIRVKLMHGEDIINVAYIKVFIKQSDNPQVELIPRRDAKDDGENIFHFACGDSLFTTVKDMNLKIYNPMNLSKEAFHTLYDSLMVSPLAKKPVIGTVEDKCIDPVEGTHVIKWTLSAKELWENAGKPVEIIARYYSSKNKKIYVDVKLTATVEGEKELGVYAAEGDYIPEYWTKNFEATLYNVMPAPKGDTIGTDAQMVTDINTSFVCYPTGHAKAGRIMIDAVDSVSYYFCKTDVEKITKIGDLNVKFLVDDKDAAAKYNLTDLIEGGMSVLFGEIQSADGKAVAGYEMQPVAFIFNGELISTIVSWGIFQNLGEVVYHNAFAWAKTDWIAKTSLGLKRTAVADTLINTGKMYTYIGADAFLCNEFENEANKPVRVKFVDGDGNDDHFTANIVRPIEVTAVSNDNYIDGVDFGEKGSYISIADLLNPIDWRQRKFSEYPNYWGYYGVQIGEDKNNFDFEVVIDTNNVECEIAGKRQPILDGMFIKQVFTSDTKSSDGKSFVVNDPVRASKTVEIPVNASGYLMYFNNGRHLTADFKLFVKATLHYGFGYYNTDWVTIPVRKTINDENNSTAADGETEPETPAGE